MVSISITAPGRALLTVPGGSLLCGSSSGPGFTHHTSSGSHGISRTRMVGACKPSSAALPDYHARLCGCAACTCRHSRQSILSSSRPNGFPFRSSLSNASPFLSLAIKCTDTTICEQKRLLPLPTGKPRTKNLARSTPKRPKSTIVPGSPSRRLMSLRGDWCEPRAIRALVMGASVQDRVICTP